MFGQRENVPLNSRLVMVRVVSNGNSMVGGGMFLTRLNAKLAAVGWFKRLNSGLAISDPRLSR